MNEKEQKYFSEVSILHLVRALLCIRACHIPLPANMSESALVAAAASNIYIICKKLRLRAEVISLESGVLKLKMVLSTKEGTKTNVVSYEDFYKKFPTVVQVRQNSESSDLLDLIDKDGLRLQQIPVEMFLKEGIFNLSDIINYEVMYIGQSFGAEGEKNIMERLVSHSKLQEILSKTSANEPYNEIFVMLCEVYPPEYFSMMDGQGNPQITGEEDTEHFLSAYNNPPSYKQSLCIAEAGLIRAFQPPYNKIFKDNFPSTNHKLLKECYRYDLNSVLTELNTKAVGAITYSESLEARPIHHIKHPLHSPKDRLAFFELSESSLEKFNNKNHA